MHAQGVTCFHLVCIAVHLQKAGMADTPACMQLHSAIRRSSHMHVWMLVCPRMPPPLRSTLRSLMPPSTLIWTVSKCGPCQPGYVSEQPFPILVFSFQGAEDGSKVQEGYPKPVYVGI
jgi:hypothetical protein